MIRIRAERCDGGLEISAVGHADFDVRGRDIVCAGVSALLFAYLCYVKAYPMSAASGHPPLLRTDGATGHILDGDDGSGGRHVPRGDVLLPTVEVHTAEGRMWVRTHDMNGADEAAWAVIRTGLSIMARRYPGHVSLHDAFSRIFK